MRTIRVLLAAVAFALPLTLAAPAQAFCDESEGCSACETIVIDPSNPRDPVSIRMC